MVNLFLYIKNSHSKVSVSFFFDNFKNLCIEIGKRSQHTLLTHCILRGIYSFESQGLKNWGNFIHSANREIFIYVFTDGILIQVDFAFVVLLLNRWYAKETRSLFTDNVTIFTTALKVGTFIDHLQLG